MRDMKKRWVLVGIVLLLTICLLVACGIPQEEYDAVVSELSTMEQELETSRADLVSTQADLASTQSTLDETQDMLEATEFLLAKKAEDYSALKDQFQQAQDYNEILREFSDNLSEELSLIKSPRHFESIDELVEWFIDNGLNSEESIAGQYDVVNDTHKCFILQVLALRDGYLLPAVTTEENSEYKMINQAYIPNGVCYIRFTNGILDIYIDQWKPGLEDVPLYPMPLSG